MTEVLEICRVAGASFADPAVAGNHEEVLSDLNDMALLARMLHIAIEATGTPDAQGTITYHGSRLTRDDFPQAFERYISIHGAVPEWSATKKIQGTIAALADRLSAGSKSALGVPNIPNFPGNASQIQSWLNGILGNSTIMAFVNTGLTEDAINQRLAASGVSEQDQAILRNLLKLVQMRDIARTATGTPSTADTMTNLGCRLSGANPNFCPDAPTPDTEGTFDEYMTIHGAAPNNTATSKVRQTIVVLANSLPQALRTELGITTPINDWVAGIRTMDQATAFLNAVNAAIVGRCGRLDIRIATVAPNQVVQGAQDFEITITGVHFPEDAQVRFLVGTEEDQSITINGDPEVSDDGNTITISISVAANSAVAARAVRVFSQADSTLEHTLAGQFSVVAATPDRPASCTDTEDNNHDGQADAVVADPEACEQGGTGEPTYEGWQLTSHVLFDHMDTNTVLQGGLGSDGSYSATRLPNVGLTLRQGDYAHNRPVWILGRGDVLANGPDWLGLAYDTRLSYSSMFQDPTSHSLDLGLNIIARAYIPGNMYFDGFGGFRFTRDWRSAPNYINPGAWGLHYNGGLAVGTDWSTDWIDTRISASWEGSTVSYDQATFGLNREEFTAPTQGLRLGAMLDMDWSDRFDGTWVPDTLISASLLTPGTATTEVPLDVPALGLESHTLEPVWDVNLDFELAFNQVSWNPVALMRLRMAGQGSEEAGNTAWNDSLTAQPRVIIDTERQGLFVFGYDHISQGARLLAPGSEYQGGTASWWLPWPIRNGRGSETIGVQLNMGGLGNGLPGDLQDSHFNWQVNVLWDVMRTFSTSPNEYQPNYFNYAYGF